MGSTNSSPPLSTRVASVFCTLNTLERSRVTLALSSLPQGWSDLHDSMSGLPITEVSKVLMIHEDLELLCCAFKIPRAGHHPLFLGSKAHGQLGEDTLD